MLEWERVRVCGLVKIVRLCVRVGASGSQWFSLVKIVRLCVRVEASLRRWFSDDGEAMR